MNTPAAAFSAQPFQAVQVIGFVLGLIGLFHAWLWWREREPGMGWFAPSFLLLAVFAATAHQHNTGGAEVTYSPWFMLVAPALAGMSLGLVASVRVPTDWRQPIVWALLVPAFVYFAVMAYLGLSGAALPRSLANLPLGVWFLGMGSLAWWAGGSEPGAGHRYIAAALFAMPLLVFSLALARLDTVLLRYYAFAPLVVLGLTLLTASLLRRRRALEAEVVRRSAAEAELTRLNASLEEQVAERTADLHNLVAGLESFNRSVSHDLRGALGGIGGLARLAGESLQRGDDALARRALPMIAEQAEHSSRLMAALLALAKVGDATLQREVVDLRRLVQQVVDQLKLEHGDRPMPRIEVANDMPSVNADPELLKPVFANLIGNAIKFTRDAGAGRIDIGAASTADGVTVDVRDNGVGFDAEAAQQLFTPFVRLHQAQFDGHGVGLSIVRRAVERHGGRVWAESRPGQGAVFSFSLPA